MKSFLFLIATLIVSASSFAQINDFKTTDERVLREREEARSRALRDKAFTPNTPSPKGSSYGDLIEEKRAKAAREAEAEKNQQIEMAAAQKRQQLLNEKYAREEKESNEAFSRSVQRRKQDTAASNERWESIRKQYQSYAFFNDKDRDVLAKLTIDREGRPLATADEAKNYPVHYQNYLSIAKTGSYEEVLSSILKFGKLTNKAEDALEALASRFPARQSDIDNAMVEVWNAAEPLTIVFDDPGSIYRLAKRLPPSRANALQNWNALIKKAWLDVNVTMYDKKLSNSDRVGYQKKYLDVANAPELVRWAHFVKEYLADLSSEELISLGKEKGLSPSFLLDAPNFEKNYIDLRTGTTFQEYYPKHGKNKRKPPVEKWKLFADAGDADAMDFLANAIQYGYTKGSKEDAQTWRRKAEETRKKDGYYHF